MINTLLAKVIGTQNERELKRLRPLVARINELEAVGPRRCPTRDLRAKTAELRDARRAAASRSTTCCPRRSRSCAKPAAAC